MAGFNVEYTDGTVENFETVAEMHETIEHKVVGSDFRLNINKIERVQPNGDTEPLFLTWKLSIRDVDSRIIV